MTWTEVQWAWKRIDIHSAASEEDAQSMVEGIEGASVIKRTVTYGDWEES